MSQEIESLAALALGDSILIVIGPHIEASPGINQERNLEDTYESRHQLELCGSEKLQVLEA